MGTVSLPAMDVVSLPAVETESLPTEAVLLPAALGCEVTLRSVALALPFLEDALEEPAELELVLASGLNFRETFPELLATPLVPLSLPAVALPALLGESMVSFVTDLLASDFVASSLVP